jgi:iron complex transport system ATP-binding protein
MDWCYRLTQVSFRYARDWILQDFTLEIGEGEIVGLIGPNGSGKTTLLRLMAGLLRAQRGMVALHGEDLATCSPGEIARQVAIVHQESRIVFPYAVAELVLMGRYARQTGWGWDTPEDLRIAGLAMQAMDVAHLADRTFQELSGGERQRTMIARALAQQPRILLLDEPTAFLDIGHQMEIYAVLRGLNRDGGVTVVLVSHDLNLASQYCDRLVLLHEGRAFRAGPPSHVLTIEHIRTVYGCEVLIDRHPVAGTPRVTLPKVGRKEERTKQDTKTTVH